MKKLALILLAVVVLIIGAALILPFVIPTETLARQLEARVEAATGRKLTIEGPIDLSILPTLAVDAQNVRLANLPGTAEPDMVNLEALQAELKLLPLLSGSVEVARFVLVQPEIHLEVDAEGRPNWAFGDGGAAAGSEEGQPAEGGGGVPLSDLSLGDIRIEDGTLTYADAQSGTSERVSDIDMSVALENLRSPLSAQGSFSYQEEPVGLDLEVSTPLALLEGGASGVTLKGTAPETEWSFEGEVATGDLPGAKGALEVGIASIPELAGWLAGPVELPAEGLQTLSITGRLEANPERVAFSEAEINLDAIEATGGVSVNLQGPRPAIEGRLDVGAVDLDPYLPEAADGQEEAQASAEGPPAAWSDEPIAMPPLEVVDLDFQLTLDALSVGELEVGTTALALVLQDGRLTADLTDFLLYDGRGRGQMEVEVVDNALEISERFELEGLQALPFLTAAADFERLEGTADATVAVTTRGRTERELVANMDGEGQAMFRDGAIVGMNLAALMRNIRAAYLDPGADETRKTDFAELGGSFTIDNGVLVNDDLRLKAPVLRVEGSGRIDLPQRLISYRLEPLAAATLEGQGGREEVEGILVPVVIEGPWHDPAIRPDLTDILQSALEDPEGFKRRLEGMGGAAEDFKEVLDQIDTGQGAREVLEQLETPEGSKALGERLEQQGVPKGLVEGLTGALRKPNEAPPDESGSSATGGEAGSSQGAEKAQPDPARQLLKGLLGN